VAAAEAASPDPAARAPGDSGIAAAAARAEAWTHALQAAAVSTGRKSQQLQEQLERDHSAILTSSGAVVYACNLCGRGNCHSAAVSLPADTLATHAASSGFAVAALVDDNSVAAAAVAEDSNVLPSGAFKLHSMPSATRKMFLQFQGCVTQVSAYGYMHIVIAGIAHCACKSQAELAAVYFPSIFCKRSHVYVPCAKLQTRSSYKTNAKEHR
jgi:hypothetical protein